jgi:hypothetical protein
LVFGKLNKLGGYELSIIRWLEKWYQSNCDTGWEHVYGVKISTIDNPGWIVKIDLVDTSLKDRAFESINVDNGNDDWIVCRVNSNVYEGVGDPSKLEEILKVFKEWSDKHGNL